MSRTDDGGRRPDGNAVVEEYVLDIRIVECRGADGNTRYRFEAPQHCGIDFATAETARLYAAVYFDVNGFEEAGTGERGVPPAIIQAGRDTLVAYFLTMPGVEANWVASFYGEKPEKVHRYAQRVRKRAEAVRQGVRERGLG
jgi:hypothetical protein